MQKIAIGTLALLVLALAATNARLQDRERILAERLASAGSKAKRKPAASIPLEQEPQPAADVVPAAATLPSPAEAPRAAAPPTPDPVKGFIDNALKTVSFELDGFTGNNLILPLPDQDLHLTDAQRSAIDRLREVQVAQSREIEEAIRNLLTAEQRQKYDGRGASTAHTFCLGQAEDVDAKAGYLGVSGGDASGGGAELTRILPDTAANASGLQPGDVILEVNGEPIPGLSKLTETIRKTGAGFAANLRIRRGTVEFVQGLQLGGASK